MNPYNLSPIWKDVMQRERFHEERSDEGCENEVTACSNLSDLKNNIENRSKKKTAKRNIVTMFVISLPK
jgi:hypothetical protein